MTHLPQKMLPTLKFIKIGDWFTNSGTDYQAGCFCVEIIKSICRILEFNLKVVFDSFKIAWIG